MHAKSSRRSDILRCCCVACLSARWFVGLARCFSVAAALPIAAATGHEYDAVRDANVNGEQE